MTKSIVVINDFNKRPYGRYPSDSEWCGENFRENHLKPALQADSRVLVDLTGYNRYGPSFIDEAFGGLVRKNKFSVRFLKENLEIAHKNSSYFVDLAWKRIEAAEK